MSNEFRSFLSLSYEQLEELNLKAKDQRRNRVAAHQLQEERLKYLTDEKSIKAVTVLFSDLEGRLHMLDYDKKFPGQELGQSHVRWILHPWIFRATRERFAPRHRLERFLLGAGRLLRRGESHCLWRSHRQEPAPCTPADIRSVLKAFALEQNEKNGYTLNAANEIGRFPL